jgi:hypothetical protein
MRLFLATACVSVLLLAACATTTPETPPLRMEDIVATALAATRMPSAEQRRAVGEARQAYEQSPDAANRLRLGALLVVLPPPHRDDAAAIRLLEPLKKAAEPPLAATLAALLSDHAADRRRLEQQLQEQAKSSRDHERTAREQERASRVATERADALQKQLEGLKQAERRMLDREEKAAKRK